MKTKHGAAAHHLIIALMNMFRQPSVPSPGETAHYCLFCLNLSTETVNQQDKDIKSASKVTDQKTWWNSEKEKFKNKMHASVSSEHVVQVQASLTCRRNLHLGPPSLFSRHHGFMLLEFSIKAVCLIVPRRSSEGLMSD